MFPCCWPINRNIILVTNEFEDIWLIRSKLDHFNSIVVPVDYRSLICCCQMFRTHWCLSIYENKYFSMELFPFDWTSPVAKARGGRSVVCLCDLHPCHFNRSSSLFFLSSFFECCLFPVCCSVVIQSNAFHFHYYVTYICIVRVRQVATCLVCFARLCIVHRCLTYHSKDGCWMLITIAFTHTNTNRLIEWMPQVNWGLVATSQRQHFHIVTYDGATPFSIPKKNITRFKLYNYCSLWRWCSYPMNRMYIILYISVCIYFVIVIIISTGGWMHWNDGWVWLVHWRIFPCSMNLTIRVSICVWIFT